MEGEDEEKEKEEEEEEEEEEYQDQEDQEREAEERETPSVQGRELEEAGAKEEIRKQLREPLMNKRCICLSQGLRR